MNLGTINDATQKLVDLSLAECRESLKSAFDISSGIAGLSGKTKAAPGRTTATSLHTMRNRVWSDLDKAFSEEIYQQCKQVGFSRYERETRGVAKKHANNLKWGYCMLFYKRITFTRWQIEN